MAKIKSTLDLIMEKTKHLSLNEEEKRALDRKELEEKVKIFTYRFVNEERDEEFLHKELRSVSQEHHEEARNICLAVLVDHFSPFDDSTRILRGIAKIAPELPIEKLNQAVDDIRREYGRMREEMRAQATLLCRKELESKGIQGSSLIPRAEASPFWREGTKRLIESSRQLLLKKLGELHQR